MDIMMNGSITPNVAICDPLGECPILYTCECYQGACGCNGWCGCNWLCNCYNSGTLVVNP